MWEQQIASTTDGITAEEGLKINFQGFLRIQKTKTRQTIRTGQDAVTGTSSNLFLVSLFPLTNIRNKNLGNYNIMSNDQMEIQTTRESR